jgi:hypothetical protein
MVEKAKYSILEKIGAIEIRQYPEMVLAVVDRNDDDSAFGLLFNYLSGENTVGDKIKMTAPVISKDIYMAFILPSTYNKNTAPTPINPRVKIKIQPKKSFAVLRFNGYTSDSKVEKMTQQLLNGLKKNKLEVKGFPFLMRYNSPFTPGFLRRNEIAVEVFFY